MSQPRCVLLAVCLLLQPEENVHAAGDHAQVCFFVCRHFELVLIVAQCNLLQAVRGALAWYVLSDLQSRLCD